MNTSRTCFYNRLVCMSVCVYWVARWISLAYHRCEVRLPARSLQCKNLGQVSHIRVQCSPI